MATKSKRLAYEIDLMFPHKDDCGHCAYGRLMETILFPVIRNNHHTSRQLAIAVKELEAAWEKTKYYKFAQKCVAKGLAVDEEFRKRGWEP